MSRFQQVYRVESSRLKDWDYSNPWWYYATINTKNHVEYFGKVENGEMVLSEAGKIAEKSWNEIPLHYKHVETDYFIIMPNHVHGIIIIKETVETRHASSLQHKHKTLSDVIGSFKSAVTKKIRESGYNSFSWQPRFYDRIIRNEKELINIRKYISENPVKLGFEKSSSENIFEI